MSDEPYRYSLWKHKKSGHYYRIIGVGTIEATLEKAVIYQRYPPWIDREDTLMWIRPLTEFMDGRFEKQ